MSSYVVTGASRGLGYEFIRQFAAEPANIVIGIVRDKAKSEQAVEKDGLKNITFIEGDIGDLKSLKAAAAEVAKITGGSLDYLINNAALVSEVSGYRTLGDFDDDFETLEADLKKSFDINVVGVAKTIFSFLPLIKKGKAKKVIVISSGMADLDLINGVEVDVAAPYSISKGAVNVLVAKYNALYKKDGILFLSLSPGLVATGHVPAAEDMPVVQGLMKKFAVAAPNFKGPLTPEESVTHCRNVIENSTPEKDGGSFVSHLGSRSWM